MGNRDQKIPWGEVEDAVFELAARAAMQGQAKLEYLRAGAGLFQKKDGAVLGEIHGAAVSGIRQAVEMAHGKIFGDVPKNYWRSNLDRHIRRLEITSNVKIPDPRKGNGGPPVQG